MRAESVSDGVEERVAALEAAVSELDDEVAAVRTDLATVTNRDVPLLKGTLRRVVGADVESVDELPDAGRAVGQRLDAYEERLAAIEGQLARLGDVGSEATSKEEKFAAVLAFAENKETGRGTVTVSPQEVKGCTGVSRRYAYDLIEAMGEAVDGVAVREAQTVPTGNGPKQKGKALLVDCEAVQGSADGVNHLTTGGE